MQDFAAWRPRVAVLFACALLLACDDPFVADSARAYQSLATGGDHSCAVSEDGAAYCWGRGLDGELGIGVKENRATPTRVVGDIEFEQITAGDNHTCALTPDGRAYCWGWNAFFQRGNPTDTRDAEPVTVTTAARFRRISAGAHHTCGVGVDSLVYCWGENRHSQLGDSTVFVAIQPRLAKHPVQFVDITSGARHTCALSPTGVAYCWGSNEYGQLGIGSAQLTALIPTRVATSEQFVQLDAGLTHTCGVAKSGRLYCWGSSEFGELGTGGVFKPGLAGALEPAPTSQLFPNGLMISAGVSHTCAVGPDGIGHCWGRGLYGQLANGSYFDHYQPQPIRMQPDHLQVGERFLISSFATGGRTHACALVDRSAYCWGTGRLGQLGVANTTFSALPIRVAD